MKPILFAAFAVLSSLAAGACASPDQYVAYCDRVATLPAASAECREQADVDALVGKLTPILEPAAGPLKVRIAFSDAAGIDSVCTLRGNTANEWEARTRVAGILADIHAVGPIPACLAGTHLELNERGAKLAEIAAEYQRCRRESQPGADNSVPSDVAARNRARRYRSCIESAQIDRGEIWLLELSLVFVRQAGGAERREVLRACTQDASPLGRPIHDAETTRIRVEPVGMTQCMAARGWEPVL